MPSSAWCRRPPTPHPSRHTPRSVGTHNARNSPHTSASPAPLNMRLRAHDHRGTLFGAAGTVVYGPRINAAAILLASEAMSPSSGPRC
jgi:hypothetical protein